ncbi:clathrin heavy chain linker domain-containing protein 1-like isoform X2 [Crassostrea virginica]|uniref:Clathrin heavy chain linker domain-containing protein 1-like isoform X2 n=1 Tax=Crassostrea virginica TaxID=6565 RepID=A0A8B8E6B6_CRAVI|nr:clathrin heavy chain linker domain-containing protein 1-like isoform X2 [Crassostrea virginica]
MSQTSSRASTPGGYPKIPPIITNESDRVFLLDLNDYIEDEIIKVNSKEAEQRYIIYRNAFNKVIEYVTAYKPLLTAIKKEYEVTIESIRKGQREADYLNGKLKAMASEPSTIRNYKKRADELEERIGIIEKDNEKLQQQLQELRSKRQRKEELEREVAEPPKRELKKDRRLIPGLSLEEATDLNLLYKNLDILDRQLKELNISFRTRYVPKSQKVDFKNKLDTKVNTRDQLLRQGLIYRAKRYRLKIAVEAAQAYNRFKPPHQTVGDAVTFAIAQATGLPVQEKETGGQEQAQGEGEKREGSPSTVPSSFEDDDPNKEKEAEMMLEYIEKFNELFEDGKYEEAAIHAANSPKGILRTSATLAKFRDVKVRLTHRSPLLAFCDAIMASVEATGAKPGSELSTECVECALNENRLDLLSHWISQDRLSSSRQIGDLISGHCACKVPCKCGCQALAQNVYTKLHLHHQAIICLLKQGRVHAGIQYAKHKSPFTKEMYVEVLRMCPSIQLMQALVAADDQGSRPLPIGVVILTVLENNSFDLVLPFIQELQNKTADDDPNTSLFHDAVLDDLETSPEQWDSLVKILQDQGYEETATNVLSTVTVMSAMKTVLYKSLADDRPDSAATQG